MADKNCMNCMHRKPTSDGTGCRLNPEMRVSRRMHCEEWRSDDTTTMTEPPVFGEGTSSLSTEKQCNT